jgi:hypothetical protein
MRTTLTIPGDDGWDRRRVKRALTITAAVITFGVAIGKLPKRAEAFAALAGTLALAL